VGLDECRIEAVVAVSDLDRARDFYEQRLGLPPGSEEQGGLRYRCAAGTALFVYASAANAGTSRATVAGWFVDDLDDIVAELASRGVAFERYDQPGLRTDERGIFEAGSLRAAWVRDPDGNTLALTEVRAAGAREAGAPGVDAAG
jgi:catechol 2,3-dioxygenase-like lactoylglutathione lyase family enzyme